ncbi:MAG TPA: ABC transporter substrate-binding protein, partial [Microbacteriaceae bacterium]|nr:ABC transporter substrate-binding protein [Microbacteriaceae bacterium]
MHARRRSRRPLILAAVVTAALTLGACASSGAPGDSDAGATGGELVWAIAGANLSAAHMDPQTSQLDSAASVQRGVLDSLVFQNADGTFSPWLASAWSISDDGLEYTFTLRDDVVFHDGTTFDADAVKANLDRIANPATASAQAASMLGADYYVGTEVVDPTTVIVSFTQPNAPFLQAASTAYLGMYSKATLDDNASKLKAGGPGITVGSGPLVMTGYVPDQEIVYERNPDYAWGPNGATAPAFDTLRVAIVPEPAVRVGMLASGEAQLASDITPSSVSTLDTSIKVDAKSVPGLPYSLFLNEAYGVFGDPLVREALSRAIDIDTAVETIYFGQYQRAWSILGPATPGYDKSLEGTWKFDPATANALLDQAGWTQRDSENYRVKNGERLS